MPWIDVEEPFAKPPRGCGVLSPPGDDAVVDLDDRWGSIDGAALTGPIDVSSCERVEISGCVLTGATFVTGDEVELDVRNCEFVDCDLSTLRFRTLAASTLVGCKLSGCDLSGATVRDVELERCLLRLVSVRMTELVRVCFESCTLDDVEMFDAHLDHVTFPESVLRSVDIDRVRFTHVDLRSATELDLRSCSSLDGCLLAPEQVHELAFVLALASGASLEIREEN